MKKSFIATAIAAIATVSVINTATACSSVSAMTEHGTLVMRSMDWDQDQKVEAIAKVYPVGSELKANAPSYKKQAAWKTKYHVVALTDDNIFHGTAYDSANDHGLNVHGQYQESSGPFLKLHKNNDAGVPAINLGMLSVFITSNYANVDEAINGLERGEWQPAFSDPLMEGMDAEHLVPAHFNLRDRDGNVALIQLNEGGELKVWRGSANDDLRFVTNEPLYQDHIEYKKQVNVDDTANNMPADYSSLNRYVRGLHHAKNQTFEGLGYNQAMAAQRLAFNSAVAIPLDIQVTQDPRESGESFGLFPTFFATQYNLNTGDIVHDNLYDGALMKFNLNETKGMTQISCANLTQQSASGEYVPSFGQCQ
ncbi:linear amide C-N hydrolase [Vibrio agarivorans]|uniref:Linear amide C-N hydrolase n=1 Tax=Vibrio agarivorans TaxID=153622 RepID=A0ABT7XYC9_9VIBR|nr:linear amide C-N hydrolase [Vibrio agarivorans]MDN2480788.1 linear amide C-N hydrolase [Vibrio agarivorans]